MLRARSRQVTADFAGDAVAASSRRVRVPAAGATGPAASGCADPGQVKHVGAACILPIAHPAYRASLLSCILHIRSPLTAPGRSCTLNAMV
ncbi:hypothetical protein Acsp03_25430 [Actinomadura sp. NBRC 104412]|nr:hypothetical protein Acsp03_25430 [Actinomadura sp. NBRC 104412]